jgi:hypothetical protein
MRALSAGGGDGKSVEDIVARWRALPPSIVAMSAVPQGAAGSSASAPSLFSCIAGCLEFSVDGSNVTATCKGLYNVKDGTECLKKTVVVRGAAVQTSGVLTHFRLLHPHALPLSARKAPTDEVAAAAESEISRVDKKSFTATEKRELEDRIATLLVGACGLPEYLGDLYPFRLYHRLSGLPVPNRAGIRRAFERNYYANVVEPRNDFIKSVSSLFSIFLGSRAAAA